MDQAHEGFVRQHPHRDQGWVTSQQDAPACRDFGIRRRFLSTAAITGTSSTVTGGDGARVTA